MPCCELMGVWPLATPSTQSYASAGCVYITEAPRVLGHTLTWDTRELNPQNIPSLSQVVLVPHKNHVYVRGWSGPRYSSACPCHAHAHRRPDLDHQRLPQVPVPQLPGLRQEEVRLHLRGHGTGVRARPQKQAPCQQRGAAPTHADGVQVLPESQLCFFTGRIEFPVTTVGRESSRDSKKATV